MDKNKQYKIALVAFTQGLEYDDRIRKEVLSIQRMMPNVSFKLFSVEFNNGPQREGITSYGVPFENIHLKSRDRYPNNSHSLLKAWDLNKSIYDRIKKYDYLWVADDQPFLNILFFRGSVLWDLHELPASLMGNGIKKIFLRFLFKKSRVLIHANRARIDYLNSLGYIKDYSKHLVIRNFPNFEDIDPEYDESYHSFVNWKGDDECVYLQSLGGDNRAPYESVKAVLHYPRYKAVIVGGFNEKAKEKLVEEYGNEEIENRLFFVGLVPQTKIPHYIKCCSLSLVFYKNTSANNLYCEANRFYQSVILGLPVVVGYNPPMKEIIDKYKFGVVADTDGSDINKIITAMDELIARREDIIKYNEKNKERLLWKDQESILFNAMNDFLN